MQLAFAARIPSHLPPEGVPREVTELLFPWFRAVPWGWAGGLKKCVAPDHIFETPQCLYICHRNVSEKPVLESGLYQSTSYMVER